MRRLPFIVALLCLGSAAAHTESPPVRGGAPIEKLAAELQLDDYQKGELTRIFDEQRAKMEVEREQLMASGKRPDPEAMREHMRRADEEILVQLQSVLTAEQIEQFKKLQERRRRHMREGMPPPHGQ